MFEPIAIVGRGCVLPGADSPDALWEAVVAGRDLLSQTPDDRWGVDKSHVLTDDPKAPDGSWTDRGGYVRGFDEAFRAELEADPFKRDAADILALDPLFHWVLSAGRKALREGGFDGSHNRASAVIGNLSFPSNAMASYAEHVWLGTPEVDPRNRFMSGLPAHLLADELGLGGGAFALDAACASSLYAIGLACEQLHDRKVDVALAGAVCRSDDLFIHVGFCALDAMSRTGQSRPFHRQADGLVPAEGAAFVALKRLDDAVAAGDTIFGVIRGVGLSNDGRGKNFLAPDTDGQVQALRKAWAQSGVDPSRLSLIEAHATGTTVGDAAEIQTLQTVFGEHVDALPIGSLKSNTGHLITAAGAAGILKVLGAMAHKTLPPTLHLDDSNDALNGTVLRPIQAARPWDTDGPRVAAVDAFGFGGNNGHVIIEEFVPDAIPSIPATPAPSGPVAIVGLGVRAGQGTCTAHFVDALRNGSVHIQPGVPAQAPSSPIALPLTELKFPPKDLEHTLGQQLSLLSATFEATEGITLPSASTSVLVGAQCDAEVCRYGARWRTDEANTELRDALAPVLLAAGVIGNMPNIPANRINSQLDVRGPSYVISSEELSGLRALEVATRALRAGDIDAAVVGAVDLSAEPVHQAAAQALLAPHTTGDASVVLTLKRLEDAERDGDQVWAVIDDDDVNPTLVLGPDNVDLGAQFGKAHAAHALLHVAAAAASCGLALRPRVTEPADRWDGPRHAQVSQMGWLAGDITIHLRAHGSAPLAQPAPPARADRFLSFDAHPPHIERTSMTEDRMPVPPSLPAATSDASAAVTAFTPNSDVLVPPPGTQATTPTAPAPTAPTTAPSVPVPLTTPAAPPAAPHVAMITEMTRGLSHAHTHYAMSQRAAHQQFLDARQRIHDTFMRALQARRAGAPMTLPPAAPVPVAAPPAPAVGPATPGVAPSVPAPAPVPPIVSKTLTSTERPGPKYDRQQLEVLASDRISKVFPEMFKVQDDFPRQVRMPMPPLLLADRVTGIDAEPGSMTTGTIWTQTDITHDCWYLHDGVMPAGVMIEAGQADLLLISWLGADFQNKGERVYRLLGCQLTYHSGLPRPGNTLEYDIHIDGHANVGDTRIFFFHYNCTDEQGQPRLTVREGQAGFFSDEELAESGGILWDPQTGEHDPASRLDPAAIACTRNTFDHEQILAFANGDGFACFGEGFERMQTHVRTPRIAPPPMSFWTRITELSTDGGPWKRGYLRAEQDITPQDWFFQGHFKDDPCMPGTMMFEACMQASSFILAWMGFTVNRDGWTFEPVPEIAYDLRCRGQVTPQSKKVLYEVFVESIEDGPWPTIYADFLCTVDGLKAFHARRIGLRLRPDYPITSKPEFLANYVEPEPPAVDSGFTFGYESLLSCAWGLPSESFGDAYARFDEERSCARLPGPPYHFMSRITSIEGGSLGEMKEGTTVKVAYDIPPDAWYFDENTNPTMPFCVLLEAALQPCGWLSCFVGCPLSVEEDLYFRNLDGTATWHVECLPDSGTLTTQTTITGISNAGGMIIVSFDVKCAIGDVHVYDMQTVFGFFPKASLAQQIGITPTDEDRTRLHEPNDTLIDLTTHPARYFAGPLAMPGGKLLMLDRITGLWPKGGEKGLGRIRSEKDVDPSEWFFKSHFYSDPVQPGSLGVEAIIQLVQFFMIETGMHNGMTAPRFEPLMLGKPTGWKYRGQVVPENKTIRGDIDIIEVGTDEHGTYAIANGYLWVDDLRIYGLENVGMRIVDDPSRPGRKPTLADGERVLDVSNDTWLADHRPTWTLPTMPAMSLLDAMAAHAPGPGVVVGASNVEVRRWAVVADTARTRVTTSDDGSQRFEVWIDRDNPALSRFEVAAQGRIEHADTYPSAPKPWPKQAGGKRIQDPYGSGVLFHGPAFQAVTALRWRKDGATAVLDVDAIDVPHGALNQGLLDAVLHAIPHDALWQWSPDIPKDVAAYPFRVDALTLYSAPPTTGTLRVQARFVGTSDGRFATTELQAVHEESNAVWLEMTLTEVLLPKGPIGSAAPSDRVAFLRDSKAVAELALSERKDGVTVARAADIKASDWLPGTVAALYGDNTTQTIAVGDHIAAAADVHPRTVTQHDSFAVSSAQPMTRWPITVTQPDDQTVKVQSEGEPSLWLDPVQDYWRDVFNIQDWPVADLYYGLIRRFVRRVHIADPEAWQAAKGRSMLFVGNHQVGVESLLFSIIAGGLSRVPTVTLAKAEHKTTWLGRLIAHSFAYPEAFDPKVITFFDRENKRELPRIIGELGQEMATGLRSVMVHVEGTRSLTCRTPVEKMSGAFIDMAMNVNAPVVPVRFVGGLPAKPLDTRLEFPLAMGQQDIWIGAPIVPETLAAVPYKDRKERVIEAINALGPPNAKERPFKGDASFQRKVSAWTKKTGVDEPHATLLRVLEEAPEPAKDTRTLLEHAGAGTLPSGKSPVDQWLREMAQRLMTC